MEVGHSFYLRADDMYRIVKFNKSESDLGHYQNDDAICTSCYHKLTRREVVSVLRHIVQTDNQGDGTIGKGLVLAVVALLVIPLGAGIAWWLWR